MAAELPLLAGSKCSCFHCLEVLEKRIFHRKQFPFCHFTRLQRTPYTNIHQSALSRVRITLTPGVCKKINLIIHLEGAIGLETTLGYDFQIFWCGGGGLSSLMGGLPPPGSPVICTLASSPGAISNARMYDIWELQARATEGFTVAALSYHCTKLQK